ncbi:hypothetical protein LV779_23700 [Streptomyces thinghirensis]|nr:hypothetical protein [Streptomyces thinghirensis]
MGIPRKARSARTTGGLDRAAGAPSAPAAVPWPACAERRPHPVRPGARRPA